MVRAVDHWEAAYEALLRQVEKPSRYLGNERGSIRKDPAKVRLRFALAFPDVYEIGQSYPGLQILYDLLNRRDDTYAERIYAPWIDLEQLLRQTHTPLVSLETFTPLRCFDIVGFTLQYELTYTNLLNMLDLGGCPLWAKDRTVQDSLVIAGGPCAFNPEPIADFLDAVLLGDGEEAIHEICDVYLAWTSARESRSELLDRLSRISGVYVPQFYRPRYTTTGGFDGFELTRPGAPVKIRKRVLTDLNAAPIRETHIVPTAQIVHDRPAIEVMRGCVKGCRFCQAGYIYRPLRERDPRRVVQEALLAVERTGQEEISLLSLSTGDYSCVNPVLAELMRHLPQKRVAVSLPSTRVDALAPSLLEQIRKVRKTGFTLAPEAGSQRLRDIIQKEYQEEELIEAARLVFQLGWRSLKLYFMIGLPTETEEDLIAIAELCGRVRSVAPSGTEVVASVSNFVPKPHTPFQWLAQVHADEIRRRQEFLRHQLDRRKVVSRFHDPQLSVLEGIFSRGGRQLSSVIYAAFRAGCRFDGWHDQCRFDLWQRVFADFRVDPVQELRRRILDEPLPWDHLDCGVSKEFFRRELARAFERHVTPDCSVQRCTFCGACDFKTIRNVDYHLYGAKAAEHRGHLVAPWAAERLGEPDGSVSWEPRGWKKVHASQPGHAKTRTASPNRNPETLGRVQGEATCLVLTESEPTAATCVLGTAEEWLAAEGEHRLVPTPSDTSSDPATELRVRLLYRKEGRAKFLGAMEVTNAFYRSLRQSGLPIAFTKGHHPLPKVSFAPATPFAVESLCEYADIFLRDWISLERIPAAMNAYLPAGVEVMDATWVPASSPTLTAAIEAVEYEFDLEPLRAKLQLQAIEQQLQAILNAQELWVPVENRNGIRSRNLRENIGGLELRGTKLWARVHFTSRGGIRPAQLLSLCLPNLDGELSRVPIRKVRTCFRALEAASCMPAGPTRGSEAS